MYNAHIHLQFQHSQHNIMRPLDARILNHIYNPQMEYYYLSFHFYSYLSLGCGKSVRTHRTRCSTLHRLTALCVSKARRFAIKINFVILVSQKIIIIPIYIYNHMRALYSKRAKRYTQTQNASQVGFVSRAYTCLHKVYLLLCMCLS